MNLYLKSAVQNLDAHIADVTEIRNRLAAGLGPVIGKDVFPPEILNLDTAGALRVQPLERPGLSMADAEHIRKTATTSAKRFKKAMRKANGGGRQVEGRSQKAEGAAGNAALSAMSAEMLAAGAKLMEPFGTRDLELPTGCSKKQAANALTRWLINKFIKRVEAGKYRRLAAFPGAAKVPAKPERNAVSRETPETTRETRVLPPASTTVVRAPILVENAPATPKAGEPLQGEPKLTPYSPAGIAVGKQLKAVFNMEELAALLPQGRASAYYFVSQWAAKHWIRKEDYDIYRKETTFGE